MVAIQSFAMIRRKRRSLSHNIGPRIGRIDSPRQGLEDSDIVLEVVAVCCGLKVDCGQRVRGMLVWEEFGMGS